MATNFLCDCIGRQFIILRVFEIKDNQLLNLGFLKNIPKVLFYRQHFVKNKPTIKSRAGACHGQ